MPERSQKELMSAGKQEFDYYCIILHDISANLASAESYPSLDQVILIARSISSLHGIMEFQIMSSWL